MRWAVLLPLWALACDEAPDGSTTNEATLCDASQGPVTWDNFGRSFVTERCQACHATTVVGEDRQGAPADVSFDTEELAWMWSDRILEVAASETASMPPRGGVDDEDRYLLEVWLTCAD